MQYGFIIDDMEWSYSRLSSFDDCKYGWYLKYIEGIPKSRKCFFSSYGGFIHKVLEQYLSGKLTMDGAVSYFLDNYDEAVQGTAPNEKIANNFFNMSLDYIQTLDQFPFHEIVDTEKEVLFRIDGHKFVGFIDVLARDEGGGLHIIDHKSHRLRKRSGRKIQTSYDKELDQYLRQQYLYSIPVYEEFGEYPKTISFNCYRFNQIITQDFNPEFLDRTKQWAISQIDKIRNENEWQAAPDAFRCAYLCDNADSCEFCYKKESR